MGLSVVIVPFFISFRKDLSENFLWTSSKMGFIDIIFTIQYNKIRYKKRNRVTGD